MSIEKYRFVIPKQAERLGQRSDVFAELALEVGRFVLVDDILFGQLVYHRNHLGEQCGSFCLVRGQTQFFDRIAGRFVVVTIAQTFLFVGTDALDGRFVVCHVYKYCFRFAPTERDFVCFVPPFSETVRPRGYIPEGLVARRGIEPLFQE